MTERYFAGSNGHPIPPERFDPFDLVVIGAALVYRTASCFTTTLGQLSNTAGAHANWRRTQRVFARQAHDAIEQITDPAP